MDYYKDIIIIKKGKCFSKLNENSICCRQYKKTANFAAFFLSYLFLHNLI